MIFTASFAVVVGLGGFSCNEASGWHFVLELLKFLLRRSLLSLLSPAMAKAMKVMKAMKAAAMKAMKKKRVSKIAKGSMAKSVVLRGTKEKTAGGLTKSDLLMNKRGKVVSKKQSAQGKKQFLANGLGKWTKAVQKARAILKLKGFVAIKKGSPLYTKAKEIYSQ